MWSQLLKIGIDYFMKNPDRVTELIDQGVIAGINALKKHNQEHETVKANPDPVVLKAR